MDCVIEVGFNIDCLLVGLKLVDMQSSENDLNLRRSPDFVYYFRLRAFAEDEGDN